MYRNLLIIIAFFCAITIPRTAFSQQQGITFKPLGPIQHVHFKQGYAYGALNANKDYLIWYEGYTHTLYIYNLNQKKVKKVILQQGRGPHEYLQLSGFTISKNNTIFLLDDSNVKFIRLKPSGAFLKDHLAISGRRPQRLSSGNGYKIFSDWNSQQSLFYLWDHQQVIPLKINDYSDRKSHNFFKIVGYSTIQGNYFIQVREYIPYLYVYNLKKKQLFKKIKFDDSEVEWGETHQASNGADMMLPPSRADIISKDIARVPGRPYLIFLLARGASKHRKYGLNKIFEYDFKAKKFVATHTLDFKVSEIAVNDHYLFAYSKDQNKIYQYKIVSSK